MDQALEAIGSWIANGERQYVCVTPAHGVMECQKNRELLRIFNQSGLTTPDGMAIVWLLKLKGYRHVTRVYGPDLMENVCKRSANGAGYRHFFYGGGPGIAEKLSECLRSKYPGLHVVGTYTPPFRSLTPEEDEEVINQINRCSPDIVWVGISTPKQERWMVEHLHKINAPVMIGVGAAFDFLSGSKPQAPRWMQRSGLEWLFRLISEPRRLWPRYAQYPHFLLLVIGQLLGILNFGVDGSIDPK